MHCFSTGLQVDTDRLYKPEALILKADRIAVLQNNSEATDCSLNKEKHAERQNEWT